MDDTEEPVEGADDGLDAGSIDAADLSDRSDLDLDGFGEAAEEDAQNDVAEYEQGKSASDGKEDDPSGTAAGSEINTKSFELLKLEGYKIEAAQDAWRTFISMAQSREAAGEAIYAALFEGAPSLQSLFTTPRAVQAMRFMNGLASFVMALDDPEKLKLLVESLGFGHLHLDVTIPRCIIFRDAIVDLFVVELAEKFTSTSKDAWMRLLNYVAGALIYCKANYAERIKTLLSSWKLVTRDEKKKGKKGSKDSDGDAKQTSDVAEKQKTGKSAKKSKGGWFGKKDEDAKGITASNNEDTAGGTTTQSNENLVGNVPTTYNEMFQFNAAVMGFGTKTWMTEVLACFHDIVTNVSNSDRLVEECSVLSLRINKMAGSDVNLAEYKSCMMASLRSLLPKDWSTGHEVAWSWLWENVERLLRGSQFFTSGRKLESALSNVVDNLTEEVKYEIRKDIYVNFFASCPVGQDFFKQSNTYLHIIADKVIAMTVDMYRNPVKMVDDISALGLRHVGYAIPTELFGPFVTSCIEVLATKCSEEIVLDAFRGSLALISKILTRTINEGSTIVMKAINTNSSKALRKALGVAPRGDRGKWSLLVQVGTQAISPLSWSLESGAVEAAGAVITDLLTIRADRDRYYYGGDELFGRHPDIVKRLRDEAPVLLPVLFDRLIWRSRLTENGLRRVNYYLKHLLVDSKGAPAKALRTISKSNDPKLACHPMMVVVSDLLWSGVIWVNFLKRNLFFLFTTIIFSVDQGVLRWVNRGRQGEELRIIVFVVRCIVHLSLAPPLLWYHVRETRKAFRGKTRNIVRIGGVKMPRYWLEWQSCLSFIVLLASLIFLALEPLLHCLSDNTVNGESQLFTTECKNADSLKFFYGMCAMVIAFLSWILCTDFAVFSNAVSAYMLVCNRMLGEFSLWALMTAGLILTCSSAVSVLDQDQDSFAGIHKGLRTFNRVTTGTLDASKYQGYRDDPVLLGVVMFFYLSGNIFLISLLIAQLSCASSLVYADMVGYARLNRIFIINDSLQSVTTASWDRFVQSLRLQTKIEFNAGDIGLAGGIQMQEPANANPTTKDQIRRFGGSTSTEMPWPEDAEDVDGSDNDRFGRIEVLIQRTLKAVSSHGGKRKASSGEGSGTNTGTALDDGGSGSGGGSDG